jgi:DNA-binding MarR family transcriptional regulator
MQMRDTVTQVARTLHRRHVFETGAALMARAQPDQSHELASGLVRLMLSMEAPYTRESRKAGLTSQQAQLMCTAARRQASIGEIADVLRCDRSNVSRLLDRLTPRGLVYRDSADRDARVTVARLSEDGAAVVKGFEQNLEARLTSLVAEWPARKRAAAADALRELVQAIHEDMAAEDGAQ